MEAVTRFLADQGFTRIYMEDLAIGEQWSTLAFAKEIVGLPGAGLANLSMGDGWGFGDESRPRSSRNSTFSTDLVHTRMPVSPSTSIAFPKPSSTCAKTHNADA